MANLIKMNGEITLIEPKNGTDFSLEELQDFVGGYIETIPLAGDRLMIVNEEGAYFKDVNPKATQFADDNAFYQIAMIYGDVVVCDSSQLK